MTDLLNPPVRRVETVETAPPRLTHRDFMRLAPEDAKAELIEGEFRIMPPPFDIHERLQGLLFTVIHLFASRFELGQVRGSRSAVNIDEHNTYEPDILFVSRAREHIITESHLTAAPDLVVEILSASTARYDRGPKLAGYSAAGVRELWLIDPYGPAGTQFFQQQDGKLVEVAAVDGVLHSLALPGFELHTAWLWPDERGALPNTVDVLKVLGVV
jgi:Uma2 family endonuclease